MQQMFSKVCFLSLLLHSLDWIRICSDPHYGSNLGSGFKSRSSPIQIHDPGTTQAITYANPHHCMKRTLFPNRLEGVSLFKNIQN